jgi:hypothetical protein
MPDTCLYVNASLNLVAPLMCKMGVVLCHPVVVFTVKDTFMGESCFLQHNMFKKNRLRFLCLHKPLTMLEARMMKMKCEALDLHAMVWVHDHVGLRQHGGLFVILNGSCGAIPRTISSGAGI